ncbi:Nn.00g091430.m01.CDS01 [Neocucurbitaria sp. VM-36]
MTFFTILHALSVLPLTLAHMQMIDPSPLRDPHSDRADEPKDYNILTPLNADGSNFACKGYQWNTPWTTVATYQAGGTYQMTLKGGATHGGGSCQLSLSCDGGLQFKVIKSIVGGCPLETQYDFTVPQELGQLDGATCLFAWTWFNKVGNREMYMNCAVVDIVPPKRKSHPMIPAKSRAGKIDARATTHANAAAQAALATYPDLFVANLAKINDCVVKETFDAVFDDPGQDVSFGDDVSSSTKPSFAAGKCTGKGLKTAGSASSSSSSSSSGSSASGNNGQWQGSNSNQGQQSTSSGSNIYSDGKWHPELYGGTGGNANGNANNQQGMSKSDNSKDADLDPVDVDEDGQQPDKDVEKELDTYLKSLYRDGAPSEQREAVDQQGNAAQQTSNDEQETYSAETEARVAGETQVKEEPEQSAPWSSSTADQNYSDNADDQVDIDADDEGPYDAYDAYMYNDVYGRRQRATRQQRWASYKDSPASAVDESTTTPAVGDDDYTPDPVFAALLAKLNNLGSTVFTLVKFASQYVDTPPSPKLADTGLSTDDLSYQPITFEDLSSDSSKSPIPRGIQGTMSQKRQDQDEDENGATSSDQLNQATVDSIVQQLNDVFDEIDKIGNDINNEADVYGSQSTNTDSKYDAVFDKLDDMYQTVDDLLNYIDNVSDTQLETSDSDAQSENNNADASTDSFQNMCSFYACNKKRASVTSNAAESSVLDSIVKPLSQLNRQMAELLHYVKDIAAAVTPQGPGGARKADIRPTVHDSHSKTAASAHSGSWTWRTLKRTLDQLFKRQGPPRDPSEPTLAPEPDYVSDPGDGTESSGAAEAMFPDVESNPEYQNLPDASSEQAFNWDSLYSHVDTGNDTSANGQATGEAGGDVAAEDDSSSDFNGSTAQEVSDDVDDSESPVPKAAPTLQSDAAARNNATAVAAVNGTAAQQALEVTAEPVFDWGSLYPDLEEESASADAESTSESTDAAADEDAATATSQAPDDSTDTGPPNAGSTDDASAVDDAATSSDQSESVDAGEEAGPADPEAQPADSEDASATVSEPAIPEPSASADEAQDAAGSDTFEDGVITAQPSQTDDEPPVPEPSESAQEDVDVDDYSQEEAGDANSQEAEGDNSSQNDEAAAAVQDTTSPSTPEPAPPAAHEPQTLGEALKAAFPQLAAGYGSGQPSERSEQYLEEGEDDWTDGVFPGLLRRVDPSGKSHPTPKPDPDEDVEALLPYFMGPGPVIPSGVSVNWPGPSGPVNNLENTPPLTNDLGPNADAEVRKFFQELKLYAEGKGPAPDISVKRQASTQLLDPTDQLVGNDDDVEWLINLFPGLRNMLDPLNPSSPHRLADNLETFPVVFDDLDPSVDEDVKKWFKDLKKSNANKLVARQALPTLPTIEELLGQQPAAVIPDVATPTAIVPDSTLYATSITPILATPTSDASPSIPSDTSTSTSTSDSASSTPSLAAAQLSALQSCLAKQITVNSTIAPWQKELAEPCGTPGSFVQHADPIFFAPFYALVRACNARQEKLKNLVTQYQSDLMKEYPHEESRYLMTGGAGPPGTLPPDDRSPSDPSKSTDHHERPDVPSDVANPPATVCPPPQAPKRRPRSRSRTRNPLPSAGPAHVSRSPTRPKGPGGTPFGELPKFKVKTGLALGFGDHFMNTYKHIKAEHDAGHRSRGLLEKKIDEMRGKDGAAKDGVGHRDGGTRRDIRKHDGRKGEGEHKLQKGGKRDRHGRRNPYEGGRRDASKRREIEDAASGCKESQRSPEVRIVPPTSLGRPHWQPTPFTQRTSPPILPLRFSDPTPPPTSPPIASSIPTPPPRPPPPPPGQAPPPPVALSSLIPFIGVPGGLLSEIRGGKQLRKVHESEKNDKSATGGSGPMYEETPDSHDVEVNEHSQRVEEQERGQAGLGPSARAWSTVASVDSDCEADVSRSPHRNIRAQLENLFGGNTSPGNVQSTKGELFTDKAHRKWMICGVSTMLKGELRSGH